MRQSNPSSGSALGYGGYARGVATSQGTQTQKDASKQARAAALRGAAVLDSPPSGGPPVPFQPVNIQNGNPGPVMWRPIKVFILWLGSFTEDQKDGFRNFVASINASSDASNTGPQLLQYSTVQTSAVVIW